MRIARCPRCGASTRLDAGNRWRPFCGERCKLIDLGEWFGERHGIPSEDQDHEAVAPGSEPPRSA